MTKIAITGAGGFLGFHLRAAAQDYGIQPVGIPAGRDFDLEHAQAAINGADKLIHMAAVNRGMDAEISHGNEAFALQLQEALARVEQPPAQIVYANSIQTGNGSVYGTAKQLAAEMLSETAQRLGSSFEDIHLPNLFGEYGLPFYNSVVATFSHLIANGEPTHVDQDRQLQLLHVQDAADILLGVVPTEAIADRSHWETVSGVEELLQEFSTDYAAGEFPDLSTNFRRDLFNTYRSYTFPDHEPINITRHADQRGAFFEVVRSRGGSGQTSFSTTVPGVTRGDHYHRRKIERFTVVAGQAEIKLRRLFSDEVFTYRVSGEEPLSIDMPTMYTHSIRNVGDETLYTAFWTNDIFDPEHTDTIAEPVT